MFPNGHQLLNDITPEETVPTPMGCIFVKRQVKIRARGEILFQPKGHP